MGWHDYQPCTQVRAPLDGATFKFAAGQECHIFGCPMTIIILYLRPEHCACHCLEMHFVVVWFCSLYLRGKLACAEPGGGVGVLGGAGWWWEGHAALLDGKPH